MKDGKFFLASLKTQIYVMQKLVEL